VLCWEESRFPSDQSVSEEMTELNPEIAGEVAGACRAGVEQSGAAFGRLLGAEVTVTVGEPGSFDSRGLVEGGDAAALVVVLRMGGQGALVVLAEDSGLIPAWCADPDAKGQTTLADFAQQLGTILFPERNSAQSCAAGRVDDLAAVFNRGGLAESASMVPLELRTADGREATVSLIWPVDRPDAVLGSDQEESLAGADGQSATDAPSPSQAAEPGTLPQESVVSSQRLPDYARSLLKIKVPVVVTLARKRQPLAQILHLGPGSIIHFDKSCEQMLDLDVGGHSVATGEAVKVGDKFGLRINSIILPDERFKPVTSGQSGAPQS
jgi:flagellar motor switch/type III secretory pathway protein FliN